VNILVFGASGYIGKRTASRLIAEGHEVTGFARSEDSAQQIKALGASAVIGQLDDYAAIEILLGKHDAALWLAQLSLSDEKNVVGNYLKALRYSGKIFIFTGGASVLSEPTFGEWSDKSFAETDSFIPCAPLAIRAETEYMVRTAMQFGVRSMVVRPPLVFGHGGCKVISDIYHSARDTGVVCYVGRGLNVYSSVHVDDLAELFVLALSRGQAGGLYHCVGGEAPFRAMAQAVAGRLGVGTRSVSVEEAQKIWDKFSGATVFASCSRLRAPIARAELGWQASLARADILEECVHPSYAAEAERTLASWIKPSGIAG
jgi:nucleoside-diphosphate-sugar epimerase